MLQKRIARESTEFLHLKFTTAPGNITTLPVQMALTLYPRRPVDADWLTAAWTPSASPPASRILIGPDSDLPLAPGTYVLWARVTAAPERPVEESDYLVVIT